MRASKLVFLHLSANINLDTSHALKLQRSSIAGQPHQLSCSSYDIQWEVMFDFGLSGRSLCHI